MARLDYLLGLINKSMTKEPNKYSEKEQRKERKKEFGKSFSLNYMGLHGHKGHRLEIQPVWYWITNREIGLEIRCLEPECEDTEPIFEMDLPKKYKE